MVLGGMGRYWVVLRVILGDIGWQCVWLRVVLVAVLEIGSGCVVIVVLMVRVVGDVLVQWLLYVVGGLGGNSDVQFGGCLVLVVLAVFVLVVVVLWLLPVACGITTRLARVWCLDMLSRLCCARCTGFVCSISTLIWVRLKISFPQFMAI